MKIFEITEMTMRVGNMDNQLKKYSVEPNIEHWKTGEHIGDIEDKRVLLYKASETNWIYSIWKNDIFIGFVLLIRKNPVEIFQAWISPEFRGQQIFSKILWFLKTREGYSPMILGNIHSRDTIEILKYLSRFKKFWVNGIEKIQYNPNDIDKFYSFEKPTEWKLLLENDGDFSSWSKYTTGYMITDIYDWQIE